MVEIYIDKVRNEKNMSIRELAAKSGVGISTITRIEAGRTNPSVEVMCKLGEALQTPICNLFRCDYDKRRQNEAK